MEMFAAAILGIIQGLTEFLPVSSSAHLILVPWLFGWQPEGLTFDVSLHLGTALAILVYFWRDWIILGREVVRGLLEHKPLGNVQRRLAWFLVLGTLPAMIVGLACEKYIEAHFRSPIITVVTLVVFALLLYFAERQGKQSRSLDQFGLADSLWIGASQALALIPGVSRSGITISAAMLRDANRSASARFSFLLSTPIVVGAAILEGWRLINAVRHPSHLAASGAIAAHLEVNWAVLITGVAGAAITGYLCIRYFLRYVQSRSFIPFVVYRLLLAVVVFFFYLRHAS